MSDTSKKIAPRIRTFAGDLDEHRKKRDGDTVTPEKGGGLPKVKVAETPIKNVSTKETPTVPKPIVAPEIKEPFVAKEKPEPTESLPKQIPAYHEVHKQVTNIQAEPAHKKARLKKRTEKMVPPKPEPMKREIGLDATVITDTKRNKMNFFSSVFGSLGKWFKDVTKPRKKKAPKYTVPEASRRKGVIQKATTQTGSIFTADNETLKEQIRRRQHDESTHKDEASEEDADTTWSPYTESGFSLLEAPDGPPPASIQNVQFEFKKRQQVSSQIPSPVPPTIKQELPEPLVEQIDDHRWDAPAPLETQEKESSLKDPVIETPQGQESTNQKFETPLPENIENTQQSVAEIEEEKIPESEDTREYDEPRNRQDSETLIERVDTNTLTVITLLTIIGIVIVIIVSKLFIQYMSNELRSDSPSISPVEVLLENSNLKTIAIRADNIDALPEQVNSETKPTDTSLTEVAFVSIAGEEVGPSYVFELFEFGAAPTLRQSLTSARFLLSSDSEEVLLLKFVDDITVRGGFLNWEETMASDFSLLYSEQETTGDFVDDKVSGHDVRVLSKDSGKTFVYSIVDDNTALIAANMDDLEKIIALKFSN